MIGEGQRYFRSSWCSEYNLVGPAWSIGNLLQNSGWTGALAEAGVVFMAAASITRIRQMHQISACSFYKLMKEAYTDYCAD